MMEYSLSRPPATVDLAADTKGVIVSTDQGETTGADVYLVALGTGLDPVSNKDYVTMRLRVNGQNVYPFGAMTSQVGSLSLPHKLAKPLLLGRGVVVDVYGEVAAGATGNTTLGATFDLLLKVPA